MTHVIRNNFIVHEKLEMREEGLYYYMKYVNYLTQLVDTADSDIAEIEAMSIVIE